MEVLIDEGDFYVVNMSNKEVDLMSNDDHPGAYWLNRADAEKLHEELSRVLGFDIEEELKDLPF